MSQVDLDQQAVGYTLKRAASALRAAMDAELRDHALSVPQYACLTLLNQRPGLSNADLARGAFVTRQAMHQLLGGLLTAGLISTTGDGRATRLELTATGAQRLTAAAAAAADIEERMLAPLDAEQRARLQSDLDACARALTPSIPDP